MRRTLVLVGVWVVSLGARALGATLTPAPEDRSQAMSCLTAAIYYEAGAEPMDGRAAVAQVVLNRLRSPAYPKTVCGVIYQGAQHPYACQFTFACDGSEARRPEARLWGEARDVAAAALDGDLVAQVGGATHYHAYYVAPAWARTMVETAHIGAHLFYRPQAGTGAILATASIPRPIAPAPAAFAPWGLTVATLTPRARSVEIETP